MKTLKTLATFALALILSSLTYGQLINGTVKDDQGTAVAYATLYAPAAETGVLTDDQGNFRIDLKDIPRAFSKRSCELSR